MTTKLELIERGCDWLLDTCFFNLLDPSLQEAVLSPMTWRDYAAGQTIIEIGVPPRGIDLIVTGRVAVAVPNQAGHFREVLRLGPGSLVGERATIRRARTSARVRALTPVSSLHLPSVEFARLLGDVPTLQDYARNLVEVRERSGELLTLLRTNDLLRLLGQAGLVRVLQSARLVRSPAKPAGDAVCMLVEGQLRLLGANAVAAVRTPGAIVGLERLMTEDGLGDAFELDDDSEVLEIAGATLRSVVREQPRVLRRVQPATEVRTLPGRLVAIVSDESQLGSRTLAFGLAAALRDAPRPALVDLMGRRTAARLGFTAAPTQVGEVAAHKLVVPDRWGIDFFWPDDPAQAWALACTLRESHPCVIALPGKEQLDLVRRADTLVLVDRGADASEQIADHHGQLHINAQRTGRGRPVGPWGLSNRNVVRIPEDGETARGLWQHAELDRFVDPVNPLGRASLRLSRAIRGRMLGVALGGGGAWGMAHIGLLRALAAEQLPVDYIAGCSAGSLIGGLYAAGGLAALNELVRVRRRILPVVLRSTVSMRALDRFLEALIGSVALADTEIPFLPVAADLYTAEQVVLTEGSVARAIRASSSLPPLFAAMELGHARLVDGGVINLVPASAVWDVGADFVIGSSVIPKSTLSSGPAGLHPWLSRVSDFMQSVYMLMWRAGMSGGHHVDFTVDLGLPKFRMHEFYRADVIARAGERRARERMASIRRIYTLRTEPWVAAPPPSSISERQLKPT